MLTIHGAKIYSTIQISQTSRASENWFLQSLMALQLCVLNNLAHAQNCGVKFTHVMSHYLQTIDNLHVQCI